MAANSAQRQPAPPPRAVGVAAPRSSIAAATRPRGAGRATERRLGLPPAHPPAPSIFILPFFPSLRRGACSSSSRSASSTSPTCSSSTASRRTTSTCCTGEGRGRFRGRVGGRARMRVGVGVGLGSRRTTSTCPWCSLRLVRVRCGLELGLAVLSAWAYSRVDVLRRFVYNCGQCQQANPNPNPNPDPDQVRQVRLQLWPVPAGLEPARQRARADDRPRQGLLGHVGQARERGPRAELEP